METVKVGWTDLRFTRVGLGTWAMGGAGEWGWGEQDDQQSADTIHEALDLGINWLDTAPIYGRGRSEEVIGRALAGMSERPLIATKCTQLWDEDGRTHNSMKRETILAEARASRDRLQIEVIDLYQIHWPIPDEGIEEAWRAIEELMDSGIVRYAGVSNFDISQMQRAQSIHPIATLQPPYSMLRRGIEDEILPYCRDHDIGVIVYSPMQKGLLTGKVTRDWVQDLPEGDHRRQDANFNEPRLSIHLDLIEQLGELASRNDRSLPELAIAWTLSNPAVTAAIVGARQPSQIQETARSADWRLDEQALSAIESKLEEHAARLEAAAEKA